MSLPILIDKECAVSILLLVCLFVCLFISNFTQKLLIAWGDDGVSSRDDV